ncbi:S8 family serine peptidase [Streptomyces sp. NPDC095817]|uniref:S8 family serine peptidase n=1 Tax=Streptomyces sp. NPDC095817 TaxID=3155082 RepID=UPI003325B42B
MAKTAVPAAVRTVTLITGDRATVTDNGRKQSVSSVTDALGRASGARVVSVGSDTYVYPDTAVPYIASGALDKRLFNVTLLIKDGYDDAHSARLPLIVSYTDAAARSRVVKTPVGARKTQTLGSIQAAALSAEHSRASDFWFSLTGEDEKSGGGARTSAGQLASGIAKVWLDGKVKATLADTTTQIGAPDVWDTGNTGRDVDVAVLDTGIDGTHPDFAGRISASKSFVPGLDVTDRNGHGTHVASTIAGTGAASGGKEKGVALGASLHVGKVLDNDGSGQDSWIVAGMEWAARDQGAKVISMSLGGEATDGTDPLSEAVNRLSAETGALFVIAAGNSGPSPYTVSAPGAADLALTVGAVHGPGKGVDEIAEFSSRGPRVGDNAIKPDLTGPGVNVVAARSQYAPTGEGAYQTMSGTSMATPHVAGAAALLAAKHPDWTGQQLKSALISSAVNPGHFSPFEAGSGRVDVAKAVKATLIASGDSYAQTHYPYLPGQTVRKDVTYTNSGAEPVTVNLALGQAPLPEGLFTLTAPQLTVPARGTASVGVITHLDVAEDNTAYAARLVATGTAGTVLATTPVGVNKEGRRTKLTITAKDKRGKALSGTVILKDIERNTAPEILAVDDSGHLELPLVPSTYAAWMNADVPGIDGSHTLGFAMLSAPQIDLTADRTVRFDAANLRKAAAITPQLTASQSMRLDQYRMNGDLYPLLDSYMPEYWRYDSLWVTPTQKVTKGSYVFATRWRQIQPPLTLSSGSQNYDDVTIQSLSPKLADGSGTYRAVWVGDGSADDFRKAPVQGQVAVVRRSNTVPPTHQAAGAAKAGARQLLILNDGYGKYDAWADLTDAPPLPVASLGTDTSARLLSRLRQPGTARLKVVSHPYPSYLYDLVRHHDAAIPKNPTYQPRSRDLARIDESFRNTAQGDAVEYRQDVTVLGDSYLGAGSTPVRAQGTLTSWISAGDDVRWMTGAATGELSQESPVRTFKSRHTTSETWFSPIQHPRLLNDGIVWNAPFRVGNVLSTTILPAWGDSGGHAGTTFDQGSTVKFALYQGNQLLGEEYNDDIITVENAAPDPLSYRLVVEGNRDRSDRPYSTRTRTEWSFTSGTTDYRFLTALPLIQLDYVGDTDLSGRTHRRTGLTIIPSHLKDAGGAGAINSVALEVSYDDGVTWRKSPLRHGDDWTAQLDAPRQARFASLRTTAKDTKGNSVSQTLIRAFGIK